MTTWYEYLGDKRMSTFTSHESPIIRNIREGYAEFTFVGKPGGAIEERDIRGKNWVGIGYLYKMTVPHPVSRESLETFVTLWYPKGGAPYAHTYERLPESQIYIESRGKDIPLSNDRDTLLMVEQEIFRQG